MDGDDSPELECFLEVQGASAGHAEEVTSALAEEIEAWVADQNAGDPEEAANAIEVARQLRLLGWLVSVELGGDTAKMMDQLEALVSRANDVLMPPVVSGIRRKFTPPVALPIAQLYGAEDEEQTVVKKAKWDSKRSANRVLDDSTPPPSKPPTSKR